MTGQSRPMSVLLVEDENEVRRTLGIALKSGGHDVTTATSVQDAARLLREHHFDFMLTDHKHGKRTSLLLIKESRLLKNPPVNVIMTSFRSSKKAAIKEGVFDYLSKPFKIKEFKSLLSKVAVIVSLKRENARLKSAQSREDFFLGLVSPEMLRVEDFVRKVAPTEANVLLLGEPGTGKTEIAKLIHQLSRRAHEAFEVVNCFPISDNLTESALFGHVKGSFSSAKNDFVGKLELAHGGTLLIDEIGDLSLSAQAKLLKFLQENIFERTGDRQPIRVDVRIIGATHRNLELAIRQGKFREDLYYRLNVLECVLIPLRERREDLLFLIHKIYNGLVSLSVTQDFKAIPEDVLNLMLSYDWPGNIPELRNVLERLVTLSQGRQMRSEDLPDAVRKGTSKRLSMGVNEKVQTLEELEREHVEKVLSLESNQEKATNLLGITTVTLWRKRKQIGLP